MSVADIRLALSELDLRERLVFRLAVLGRRTWRTFRDLSSATFVENSILIDRSGL